MMDEMNAMQAQAAPVADTTNEPAAAASLPVSDPMGLSVPGLDATTISPLGADDAGVFADASAGGDINGAFPPLDLESAVDQVLAKARHAVVKGHAHLQSSARADAAANPDPFAVADELLSAAPVHDPHTASMRFKQAPVPNDTTTRPPSTPAPAAAAAPSAPVIHSTDELGQPIHIVVDSDKPSLAPSDTEIQRNRMSVRPALKMTAEEVRVPFASIKLIAACR